MAEHPYFVPALMPLCHGDAFFLKRSRLLSKASFARIQLRVSQFANFLVHIFHRPLNPEIPSGVWMIPALL